MLLLLLLLLDGLSLLHQAETPPLFETMRRPGCF